MHFYHDMALTDPSSTMSLYAYTNQGYVEIARCVKNSNLSMTTQMSWAQYDMDFEGDYERSILKTAEDNYAKAEAKRKEYMAKQARQNVREQQGKEQPHRIFTRMINAAQNALESSWSKHVTKTINPNLAQEVLVTATDSYKKYDGSTYALSIPSATFYFFNEGDTSAYLDKVFMLLDYILPSYRSDVGVLTQENNTGYYRIEVSPNDFQTPNTGFNFSNIQGDFNLRVGYDLLEHLIPTNVTVEKSDDYDLINLESIELSSEKRSKELQRDGLKFIGEGLSVVATATALTGAVVPFTAAAAGAVSGIASRVAPGISLLAKAMPTYKRKIELKQVKIPNMITVTVDFDWATKFTADQVFQFALNSGGSTNGQVQYL